MTPPKSAEPIPSPGPGPLIRYVVSSHVRYMDTTLPVLLPSMRQIGPGRIVVAVGGADRPREEVRDGVTFLYVEHNSFDWTGPIEVAERSLPADWWFWLHDTCECGPRFRALAEGGFHPERDMTVAFRGQCNFGMYRHGFLLDQREYLSGLRGLTKEEGIVHEGGLYRWDRGTRAEYADAECQVLGETDV